MDNLVTIAAIFVLVLFSVGVTLFLQRRQSPLKDRNSSTENRASPSSGSTEARAGETAPGEAAFTVTFSKSGEQHSWDPKEESLLAFAESRNIAVESQCRAGECGSCRSKLTQGEVEYTQEPQINPGEGCCLLCISVPKSDLTLER